MLQKTNHLNPKLRSLAESLGCPARVRQVFIRCLDYYYVPRSQTNKRAARKYVRSAIALFEQTGQLPDWLEAVYARKISGKPTSSCLPVTAPFSQR